jgi:2-methylcitrate dehydratase PrpD
MDMTVALQLGKRIVSMRYEDLPPEAIHWAKVSFIDAIGCALAAVDEEAPRIAERVLCAAGSGGASLVWGTTRRASVLDAATINGTAAHALDYDDVGLSIAGHPTVPILPGLFALAESVGASGRDVLLAFVAGFETQSRLGLAVNPYHYESGWHPTSTLGVFGATAACARLLGLDAERTATALATATSLAAGLKANFGTMTKPLHTGQCTRHGAYAALLAREGFTASHQAFEHKQGFFQLFNGAGHYDPSKVLENWANPLDIVDPGVGLKQYPCCASTHSPIDATLMLREKHGLTPECIAKIESVTHTRNLDHTNRPDPRSTLDAKFSVQYCVARALAQGSVSSADFENDAFLDPQIRALMSRVEARPHAHAPRSMDDHFECEVIVTTTDGKVYAQKFSKPLRGPQNLAPSDRLESKFNDCAAKALGPEAIPRLYAALQAFEALSDARALATLMAESTRRAAQRAAA